MADPQQIDTAQVLISMAADLKRLQAEVSASRPSLFLSWAPAAVGIVTTVVALIVGLLTRATAMQQIETTRTIATDQMAASRGLANAQIESTKTIALNQMKADLIVASRKEWIESLRTRITTVFAIANKIHADQIDRARTPDAIWREFWETKTYVELLLNPNEQLHAEMVLAMAEFVSVCSNPRAEDVEMADWAKAQAEFLNTAKKILKEEWERVKALS
jgi:hypothetical protein